MNLNHTYKQCVEETCDKHDYMFMREVLLGRDYLQEVGNGHVYTMFVVANNVKQLTLSKK